MKVMLTLVLTIFAISTLAQTPLCDKISTELSNQEKTLAYLDAAGAADNSAPREALRKTKVTNHLLIMNMTIQWMLANKCKLPDLPPNGSGYGLDAYTCALAEATTRNPPECDVSKWTRKR